ATQLGIFLGYARGGWWGGLIGGLCFVLPAFGIMLGLTVAYARFRVTPVARSALYRLGPVVIGLFAIPVYRPRQSGMGPPPEVAIAVRAAAASAATPVGIVGILILAGLAGLVLFFFHSHSRQPRAVLLCAGAFLAVLVAAWWLNRPAAGAVAARGVPD